MVERVSPEVVPRLLDSGAELVKWIGDSKMLPDPEKSRLSEIYNAAAHAKDFDWFVYYLRLFTRAIAGSYGHLDIPTSNRQDELFETIRTDLAEVRDEISGAMWPGDLQAALNRWQESQNIVPKAIHGRPPL